MRPTVSHHTPLGEVAIYLMLREVITNEGDKNMVVAASINADGTLVCILEILKQYRQNSH